MTLQECYEAMGASYDEVMGRLRSEKIIKKFALRFLDDPSFGLLVTSMEAKDYAEAFRGAHTIKGICANLGFSRLQASSSALTEALRGGWTPEADALLERTREDYRVTVEALRAFRDSDPA